MTIIENLLDIIQNRRRKFMALISLGMMIQVYNAP